MSGDYAAVVVGGGPAGTVTAITLARLGQRVLLVDDSAGGFKIGEALAPAALPLLRDLGVMERFLADGHRPSYGNISAWGSSEAQCTDFVFNPYGHGWHLDRTRFDAMFQDQARIFGTEVLSEARFTHAEQEKGGWCITLRIGEAWRRSAKVHANWLIDATGRRAVVARRLGVERLHEDRLVAFYAQAPPLGERSS